MALICTKDNRRAFKTVQNVSIGMQGGAGRLQKIHTTHVLTYSLSAITNIINMDSLNDL